MKIKFEFETEIETNDGEKTEKKISLSDLKEKTKKFAEDVAIKATDIATNIVLGATDVFVDALCAVSDVAKATSEAIDDYLAGEQEEEKSFEEKLSEIPQDQKLTLAELLDATDVYSCEEKIVDPVEAVCEFFANIGYCASEISTMAFVEAITSENITYEAIAEKIVESKGNISEEEVISNIIEDFNNWLDTYDAVRKICPKPNARFLLIYFAKKVKGA